MHNGRGRVPWYVNERPIRDCGTPYVHSVIGYTAVRYGCLISRYSTRIPSHAMVARPSIMCTSHQDQLRTRLCRVESTRESRVARLYSDQCCVERYTTAVHSAAVRPYSCTLHRGKEFAPSPTARQTPFIITIMHQSVTHTLTHFSLE